MKGQCLLCSLSVSFCLWDETNAVFSLHVVLYNLKRIMYSCIVLLLMYNYKLPLSYESGLDSFSLEKSSSEGSAVGVWTPPFPHHPLPLLFLLREWSPICYPVCLVRNGGKEAISGLFRGRSGAPLIHRQQMESFPSLCFTLWLRCQAWETKSKKTPPQMCYRSAILLLHSS